MTVSKTVLFYWSKGADMRRKIIKYVENCENEDKSCFINSIASEYKVSHVAIKKHVDLLVEEKYIKPINPNGKPIYLKLTCAGKKVFTELTED